MGVTPSPVDPSTLPYATGPWTKGGVKGAATESANQTAGAAGLGTLIQGSYAIALVR
jgi:hypothetical protein